MSIMNVQEQVYTKRIADRIGRVELASAVGVSKAAVSNAVVTNRFPASWYAVIKDICNTAGIECPLCAFNFKALTEPQDEVA